VKRLHIAADPENVGTGNRTAVVVSTRGAAVTLVDAGGQLVVIDLARRRVSRRAVSSARARSR
jgi:hypothetical protein